MKNIIFFILLISYQSLKGQIKEFDKACEVIRTIHGNKIKKIIVSEKQNDGNFDLYTYFFKLNFIQNMPDCKRLEEELALFEKKVIKSEVPINLKQSKYFRKKGLNKIKSAILISYVRFDGKLLRIDAEIGSFWKAKYKPSTSIYQYQFIFNSNGEISHLDWIERKE
jgi:hypothetical protein